MPLFEADFEGEAGTVNLKTHDPGWQYPGPDNDYLVFVEGYAQGNDPGPGMASHDYDVPVGTSVRIVADLVRENVDQVGGGFLFSLYFRAAARGTADRTDRLEVGVRRSSFGTVQVAAVWYQVTDPDQVGLTSDSVEMLGNDAKRFIWEISEATGIVRQFMADFGTGANQVLISESLPGALDASLIAHAAGDRHVGMENGKAGVGVTAFRLYGLTVEDLAEAPVLSGPECTLRLTVFADDNVTPLWEVATDPAHAFPYLEEPDGYGEHELDLAKGSATTGEVRVTIIDKAIIAGDQDGGFMASKLYELGIPAIGGRRCRLIRFVASAALGYQVIVDGPAGQPVMVEGYAGFSFEIRDWHEKLRKVRMFDVLTLDAPALVGAAPAGDDVPGSEGGITWGSLYH